MLFSYFVNSIFLCIFCQFSRFKNDSMVIKIIYFWACFLIPRMLEFVERGNLLMKNLFRVLFGALFCLSFMSFNAHAQTCPTNGTVGSDCYVDVDIVLDGDLTIDASVQIDSGYTLDTNDFDLINDGYFTSEGGRLLNTGLFENLGEFIFLESEVENSGSMLNQGTLYFDSDSNFYNVFEFVNQQDLEGYVDVHFYNGKASDGTIYKDALFGNETNAYLDGDYFENYGYFSNSGDFIAYDTSFYNYERFENVGEFTVQNFASFINSGDVTNTGT